MAEPRRRAASRSCPAWLALLIAACAGGSAAPPPATGADGLALHGGDAADRLIGRDGADRLEGHAGDDQLDGGAGPDELNGGPGTDVLHGGGGADRFVVDAIDLDPVRAPDRISDFRPREGDVIELRGFGRLTGDSIHVEGGVVTIRLAGGARIPVIDVGRDEVKLRIQLGETTLKLVGDF